MKALSVIAALLFLGGMRPPAHNARTYLALGDSYTIGQSVAMADRYPVQAARLLNASEGFRIGDPDILATTGWTTGNLLDALAVTPPVHTYDLVTLLIGVNNQFQGRSSSEYREQFTRLLQQAIVLAGNRPSHVIVLSIPDYSVVPFSQGRDRELIAAQIDLFNRINLQVARAYNTGYLDITAESRRAATDPSLVAADGLHFSGKEYKIWGRLMKPLMKTALQ